MNCTRYLFPPLCLKWTSSCPPGPRTATNNTFTPALLQSTNILFIPFTLALDRADPLHITENHKKSNNLRMAMLIIKEDSKDFINSVGVHLNRGKEKVWILYLFAAHSNCYLLQPECASDMIFEDLLVRNCWWSEPDSFLVPACCLNILPVSLYPAVVKLCDRATSSPINKHHPQAGLPFTILRRGGTYWLRYTGYGIHLFSVSLLIKVTIFKFIVHICELTLETHRK